MSAIKRKSETPENGVKTKKQKKTDIAKKPNTTKDGKTKKFSKENKFQKGTLNKQKPKNLTEKPPNWNDFKKQKKELKTKRKQAKPLYEISVKAKKISEKLRQKNLKGGKEERDKLVKELHTLLGGKGNYVQLVLSHDMGRVVQYLLKYGQQDIRDAIAEELIPSTVVLIQSVYGKYCIRTLLKYGNARNRLEVLTACYGNAVKLASHSVSAPVFEFAYSMYAQKKQKQHLIQEFFGDIYKKSKDNNVKHLRDVYKNSPDMKDAALGCTKANLQRILNKKLLDSGLVQSVLYQYLSECSENDKSELLSQLAPHVVVLSNTKDGARVAMMIVWNGTNKGRKVAMKALKEHVIELCNHEFGHTVIIALLDSVDDTVILNKTILTDILNNTLNLAKNEWGRKILMWLVSPANPAYFHPTFVAELEKGRENSTCKKSLKIRREEILNYSINILTVNVLSDTKLWFENASIAFITLAIIKSSNSDQLEAIYKNIAKLMVDPDWKIIDSENDKSILGIEHGGVHIVLKKLLQHDKNVTEGKSVTLSEILCDLIDDDLLKIWTELNRGCFILVTMLEYGPEEVQTELKQKLTSYIPTLRTQTHTGAKILLKKLK